MNLRYLNFARMSKATGESAKSSLRITQRQLESWGWNRLLIKCIIRYEEYFDELALIVSCRVHQSDVDLDNVVVDAPEEEVEEDMKT